MADGELKDCYRANLKHFDLQAVETASTGEGVPDVNYCITGVEGWIENKTTDSWKVEVRAAQVGWIERRTRAGGRVFIAVRQRGRGRDVLWLLSSGAARALIDGKRLDELGLLVMGRWEGGPSGWDWGAVEAVLKGPRAAPF